MRQSTSSVHVTLDGRRDPLAFATWRAQISPVWDVTVSKAAERTFCLSSTTWQFPQAFLHRSAGSAQMMHRSRALIASSPLDHVQIFRLDKGQVAADYHGRHVDLRAGDFVLIDYMQPTKSRNGAFGSSSLMLPRAAVPARLQDARMHGSVLAAGRPAAQLLGRHLDALLELVDHLALDEADAALAAVLAVAAAIWPAPVDGLTTTDDDAAMLDKAMAMIRASLGDPGLSPAALARDLGISRTHLYMLFEPKGGVSAIIQKMRLDESLKALVAEPMTIGVIAAVAGRFGFKSTAHFSRAFSERFGRSPRKVATLTAERVGGLKYAAWLSAQNQLGSPEMIVGWLDATEVETETPKRRGTRSRSRTI